MRNFYYHTNCVGCGDGKAIQEMVNQSIEITWDTFRKHVPVDEVRQIFPFYSYRGEKVNPETGKVTAPMHIKDDFAVSFYRSKFRGQRCYYLVHSGIEYIFLAESP